VISSFYSVFLPLLVDSGEGQLPVLYGVELLGSVCGVIVLFLVGGLGLQTVFVIYAMGLLLILTALKIQPLPLFALTVACILWLILLPNVNKWSNAVWYMQIHNLPSGTTTLFSGYSAYQKVDVLQGSRGERYLFLDGLEHFGGVDGSQLNVILGQIPSQLLQPENALVIGAGSMEMAAMIADHAGLVTTVEIDPAVVDASLRYFDLVNRMSSLDNRRIVIDDAKHYIANTSDRYDLVSTDTPAAYAIQTATLYSASFYQAIAARLNPGGVLAANLTSDFAPDDVVSRRVAASLLTAFDEVIVVTSNSAGWSFAYASDDLPFDRVDIENALRASGETGFIIFDTPAVRAVVGDARPITLDSMDIVLRISLDWIQDRWN
ncbi:MAG: fused MFS/spermidine synthase, partial [Chitinophagaceae bacterium]|nr:fused MFS/spermidine synthase [Anaerolineae bacterium]